MKKNEAKKLFSIFVKPLLEVVKPDSSTETKIKFKGKRYFLIGDMETGGAIATKKQYEAGECSYAHLYPDGSINRFGEIIGTKDEITIEEDQ